MRQSDEPKVTQKLLQTRLTHHSQLTTGGWGSACSDVPHGHPREPPGKEARLCTQPCPAQPVPRALVLLSNSQGRDKGRTQGSLSGVSLSGETHPTYQAPPSRPTCQRHLRPQPTRFRQLSPPPPPSPAPPSAGLRLLCPTRNSPHFRSSTNSGQATKRASPVISPPPAPRAAAPLCATPCRGADEQEAALAP